MNVLSQRVSNTYKTQMPITVVMSDSLQTPEQERENVCLCVRERESGGGEGKPGDVKNHGIAIHIAASRLLE
jgi:hypothetical protein